MKKILIIALFCISLAQLAKAAEQEFKFETITRRSGGSEVNQTIEGVGHQLLIILQAQKYPIILHDITFYTESTEMVTLKDIRNALTLPTNANDQVLLNPNAGPVQFIVNTTANINGFSMIVESMGGFADISVKVRDYVPATPQPPPVTPPPTSDNEEAEKERQCQNQLVVVAGQISQCSSNTVQVNSDIINKQSEIEQLQQTLNRINAPLKQCQEDLTTQTANYNAIVTELNMTSNKVIQEREETRKLREERQEAERSKGRSFKCIVVGRHGTFIGADKTKGSALFKALSQCGEGSCGKSAWNQNFRCDLN